MKESGLVSVLIIICLLSNSLQAEQIYKCTDNEGHVSFQKNPCTLEQGKPEKLEIDNEADPSYVPERFHQPIFPRASTRNSSKIKSDYKKRRRETDKKICQIYKDALSNAEMKWKAVRRQGYKQWEKEHYTDSIRRAEQDVKRECN